MRPTHLPRFGKTLTNLTSRRTAAPKESLHRATQARRKSRMFSADDARTGQTRRRLVTLSIASGVSASLLLFRNSLARDEPPLSKPSTYNGSTDPYPIPWLDKK